MLSGFPVCACSTTTTCQPSFQRLPLNGRSYDMLTDTRWRTSKSDGPTLSAEIRAVLRRQRAVVRIRVGGLRQRVRAGELQPVRHPAVRGHPQPLVVGPAEARLFRDVAERRAREDRARRRQLGIRTHGAAGGRELVEVDRDALPVAVRSEVADHQAGPADLALDVDVPRLHPARQEIRIGERRVQGRGARAAQCAVELDVARRRARRLPRQRRRERRIVGLADEVAGVALVHHHGVGAAHDQLAVAGRSSR